MASLYKIGAVSRQTGVSVSTLRSWETVYGLLSPQRTIGGTRLYSDDDVERARHFRMLLHERGYSLSALAEAVEAGDGKGESALDQHYLLRRLVRANPGWPSTVAFVEGARALTGVAIAALGLYLRWRDAVFFAVTARAGGQRIGGTAIAVSEFPRPWQEAISAQQPCSHSDLFRLRLPDGLATWVRETRMRSFYAEPLIMGHTLLGVLMIGSPIAAGLSGGAREVCARLAVSAGPALSVFAAQF